ncbi:MAG: hypothetical protein K2K74_03940 [Lachnospiraceae bacterium]|nr:hypothetical protein [Lachnospiraceae bacterium]
MKARWKMWLGIFMAVIMMTGMGIDAKAAQADINNCLVYYPVEMTWDEKQVNISGSIGNTSDTYDIYELEDAELSVYDSSGNYAFTVYMDDASLEGIVLSPGETREYGITVSGSIQNIGYRFSNGFYAFFAASFTYQKCGGRNCKICSGTQQNTVSDNSGLAGRDALNAEMRELMNNKPSMTIPCTYCGGDGKLDKRCESCNGSGRQAIPGITMFSAFVPCSDCRDGYQICAHCTFGMMFNPDYNEEQEAWTEKRHDIWCRMGYSDAEIRRMEIDEAKAYIDSYEPVPSPCPSCNGSKKCWMCHGSHQFFNGYGYQDCTKCTDGTCTTCGGTGQR